MWKMKKGKFYTAISKDGAFAGEYISENNEGILCLYDWENKKHKFVRDVHDELKPIDPRRFMMDILVHLEIPGTKIKHDYYEFKLTIPRPYGNLEEHFDLNKIEHTMNHVLEDYWSAQWCELENNSIHIGRDEVVVKFRVHPICEVELRSYGKEWLK